MNVLNKQFKEAIEKSQAYLLDSEYDHFLENPSKDHIYLNHLKIEWFLGNQSVNKEIAEAIINLPNYEYNCEFTVLGVNQEEQIPEDFKDYPYTSIHQEDLENGEIPKEYWLEDDFIIEITTK